MNTENSLKLLQHFLFLLDLGQKRGVPADQYQNLSGYVNGNGEWCYFRESSKALFSNLKFIQIALAKSPNAGRVSHRQLFMGNCLTISNTC